MVAFPADFCAAQADTDRAGRAEEAAPDGAGAVAPALPERQERVGEPAGEIATGSEGCVERSRTLLECHCNLLLIHRRDHAAQFQSRAAWVMRVMY